MTKGMKQIGIFACTCSFALTTALAESPHLDPYRACTNSVETASKGDPVAQHTCFVAAYVRLNDPMLGGEDMEGITHCLGEIVGKVGDAKFAQALKLERPEIIAAVGSFLNDTQLLAKAPATQQLLRSVPKIVFPYDQALKDQNSQSKSVSPLARRMYGEEKK